MYNTYFVSQERTLAIAKLLGLTTLLNVGLNYYLITEGLKVGMHEAVLGACIATVISRVVYLMGVEFIRRE